MVLSNDLAEKMDLRFNLNDDGWTRPLAMLLAKQWLQMRSRRDIEHGPGEFAWGKEESLAGSCASAGQCQYLSLVKSLLMHEANCRPGLGEHCGSCLLSLSRGWILQSLRSGE